MRTRNTSEREQRREAGGGREHARERHPAQGRWCAAAAGRRRRAAASAAGHTGAGSVSPESGAERDLARVEKSEIACAESATANERSTAGQRQQRDDEREQAEVEQWIREVGRETCQ